MKRTFSSLEFEIRQRMEGFVEEYVEKDVLFESPAYPALRHAYGGEPDIDKLRRKLGKPHNIRLFAARIAAALAEYIEPMRRQAIIDYMIDRRYWLPEELTGLLMADALAPHRTSTRATARWSVRSAASCKMCQIGFDEARRSSSRLAPGRSRRETPQIPYIAVADIAAGIAGDLYRSSEGLRRVADRFRMVILNGAVVKL